VGHRDVQGTKFEREKGGASSRRFGNFCDRLAVIGIALRDDTDQSHLRRRIRDTDFDLSIFP
jgi:hypothetical protein